MLRTSFNYLIVSGTSASADGVGQERLELSTPRLSSACSNQLSYWPAWIGLSRQNSMSSYEVDGLQLRWPKPPWLQD